MMAEFQARAERLAAEGERAPDLSCPFLESSDSADPRDTKDWDRFAQGDMGESGTSRWIGKGLKELETLRKKLAAAEKPAAAAWDKKHKDGRKQVDLPPAAEEFIYDIQVQARNLGVILDNSPSMRKALPAVRAEISRRFSAARFVEVDGCQLEPHSKHWGLHGEWYYATVLEERNPFATKWFLPAIPQDDIHYHMIQWQRDPLAAIESMIILMEVDALYWFCDFDDEIQLTTVKTIGELIEKHKVRLYVHTVKSNPPGSLSNIIKRSGGKLTRAEPVFQKPTPEELANAEAQPITPEVVKASENQVVRLTGTLRHISVFTNYNRPAVHLHSAEADLTIDFPRDAYPATASHAVIRGNYPPGRRFEVTGRIVKKPGNSGHTMELESMKDFKWLPDTPPEAAKRPADPAADPGMPDIPAAPGEPAGPFEQINLSDAAIAASTGKDVQFAALVESVQEVEGGHIRILLAGVDLRLGCMAKYRQTVIPVSGIRARDLIFVKGRIIDLKGKPVMELQSAGQVQLLKAPPLRPAPGGDPVITLTDAGVTAHHNKAVKFEAVVKSVERMTPGNHIKIHFEGAALYAICQAEKAKEIFPAVDPVMDVQPGDKVRVKGRITLFRDSPQVILDTRDQFLTIKRVRDVPGTGGREKQVEQTTEIDIK